MPSFTATLANRTQRDLTMAREEAERMAREGFRLAEYNLEHGRFRL